MLFCVPVHLHAWNSGVHTGCSKWRISLRHPDTGASRIAVALLTCIQFRSNTGPHVSEANEGLQKKFVHYRTTPCSYKTPAWAVHLAFIWELKRGMSVTATVNIHQHPVCISRCHRNHICCVKCYKATPNKTIHAWGLQKRRQ